MDPGGILLIPSLYHDWGYRHDFYLDDTGRRVDIGQGKRFHDQRLRAISAAVNDMSGPGMVAVLALDVGGWPAWWANCRRRTGKIDLRGEYAE